MRSKEQDNKVWSVCRKGSRDVRLSRYNPLQHQDTKWEISTGTQDIQQEASPEADRDEPVAEEPPKQYAIARMVADIKAEDARSLSILWDTWKQPQSAKLRIPC